MMHGYGWNGTMWSMGWVWLLWLLLLAAAITFAVWIVRSIGPTPGSPTSTRPDSAEEILRKRYARGEIGQDEFEERMNALHRYGGSSPA